MTDLSQMIRWNAGFVRGLAQRVLERAKVIRSSLNPYVGAGAVSSTETPNGVSSASQATAAAKAVALARVPRKAAAKKPVVKKAAKRVMAKKSVKSNTRRSKKANG